ncbi:hypothetical protein [Dietzia sp.]|uniref:hypothetical protein n=1 Tax=Dietzia sp. TaxID=1871616 RepID=UPI002FDB7296
MTRNDWGTGGGDEWRYDYPSGGGYPSNPGQEPGYGQGRQGYPQQSYNQQQGGYPGGGQAHGRSPVVPIVAGVVAVALIAAVSVLAFVWMNNNGGNETSASPTSTTYVTGSNDAAGQNGNNGADTRDVHSSTVVPTTRPAPERPSTPAGASPCSDSGAHLFGRAATGSSVTTCGFANAVRDAYAGSGAGGGPRTVSAFSPTTGQSYSMYCAPAGTNVVQCTGGNNAVVYVY